MKRRASGTAKSRNSLKTGTKQVEQAPPPTLVDLSHIVEGLRPLAFPLADLVPDMGNSMSHPEANLKAIEGSLRQFGQTQAIIAQRETRVIRAGHGRLEAMRRLYAAGDKRWENVAVVFTDWDNVTGAAYSIADNRTAELAEWDKAALEKQIREIQVGDEDLQAMYSQLAEDLDLVVLPEEEEPEVAEAQIVPERYQVVVTCADEEGQRQLLEQLEQEGWECRALVV